MTIKEGPQPCCGSFFAGIEEGKLFRVFQTTLIWSLLAWCGSRWSRSLRRCPACGTVHRCWICLCGQSSRLSAEYPYLPEKRQKRKPARPPLLRSYHAWVRINAPIGQKLEHFPQRMHLAWSTVGALKPFCDSAPTGQTRTEGQGWFCGQRSCRTCSIFFTIGSSFQ